MKLRICARAAALSTAVVAVGLVAAACSNGTGGPAARTVTVTPPGSSSGAASSGTSSSTTPSPTAKPATPVHLKLTNSDGATYGVGMPVIAYFNRKPTDAKAFQAATTVTVDNKPTTARWYFEYSSAYKGYPVEAHLRPQSYWPAHSKIHVSFPKAGTSLGQGLATDGKLTSLDFSTGARNIALVDDGSHTITVTSDGKQKYKFPVSLGANNTPTRSGIKVIMEKGASICMHGPNYSECGVKYTQRLTYDGEYLHAAPWNTYNIGHGVDSSNGCTNMYTDDAQTLYGFLNIGDVVTYPNANGGAMQLGLGYGDWNVNWSQWQTGGLVSTTA